MKTNTLTPHHHVIYKSFPMISLMVTEPGLVVFAASNLMIWLVGQNQYVDGCDVNLVAMEGEILDRKCPGRPLRHPHPFFPPSSFLPF